MKEARNRCECKGKDFSTFASNYNFELIPDTVETQAAGYTEENRKLALVWYGPAMDEENFYYTAWTGPILGVDHLSSILVCRKRSDGSLVYAKDCTAYSLDSSPNFLGDSKVIARCRVAIQDETLYLVNAVMTNIGPQLYAINKKDGNLKWAAAYYTPQGAPEYITEKGNYQQFRGSNMRVSDLNPVVKKIRKGCECKTFVFVGSSSFQNALNVGLLSPQSEGIPIYTDQGFLFCIEDLGKTSSLVWKTPTCAPVLKVGDTIVKGGDPEYDPFRPDSSVVVINSVVTSTNYFTQAYYVENPPSPATANTTPIAAKVIITKESVINPSFVQPVWGIVGKTIYQDTDRTTSFTLDEILNFWIGQQQSLEPGAVIEHTAWSFVGKDIVDQAIMQEGNIGISYFKYLTSGHTITEEADAQGLNYWGNTTWGENAQVDKEENMVYFGTGQTHSIPVDESLFYDTKEYNFNSLIRPVYEASMLYQEGMVDINRVNKIKQKVSSKVRTQALDVNKKSPRGRMSYSDAIIGAYILSGEKCKSRKGGEMAFGVRILSWDSYSFLNILETTAYPFNVVDGDVSSSARFHTVNGRKYVSTPAKSGMSFSLDVTDINPHTKYNHENLERKKVVPLKWLYSGSPSVFGGSVYQATNVGRITVSSQGNMNIFNGPNALAGLAPPQNYVTNDGRVFDVNNSYIQGFNAKTGEIIWETPYYNRAFSQVGSFSQYVFTQDDAGNLYILDGCSGKIVWKDNGRDYGMLGGIVAPAADKNQVIWMNNYSAYGILGSAGPNGASFVSDPKLAINRHTRIQKVLAGNIYTSWDSQPKFSLVPSDAPKINTKITHTWKCGKRETLKVEAVHETIQPPSTKSVCFVLKNFCPEEKKAVFKTTTHQGITYISLEFVNKNIYELKYKIEGEEQTASAWLKM